MKLDEYAEALGGLGLDWHYRHHRQASKRRFEVRIHSFYLPDPDDTVQAMSRCSSPVGILAEPYGEGKTPEEAMADLVEQIRGQEAFIYECNGSHRKLYVPENLKA